MPRELIYTSAQRGLHAGSKGFCVVAESESLPSALRTTLESLSSYRHGNPVVYSHLIIGGASVLSRIADAGLDYSGRNNKLAHHLVLSEDERHRSGPAALLAGRGNFSKTFAGEPHLIPERELASAPTPRGRCDYWQKAYGDAGWAAVLGEAALNVADGKPMRRCWVVVDADTSAMRLAAEALSLVPRSIRWSVTFQTMFTGLPAGVDCLWKFVLVDSPEHHRVAGQAGVIDCTADLAAAPDTPLAQDARRGTRRVTRARMAADEIDEVDDDGTDEVGEREASVSAVDRSPPIPPQKPPSLPPRRRVPEPMANPPRTPTPSVAASKLPVDDNAKDSKNQSSGTVDSNRKIVIRIILGAVVVAALFGVAALTVAIIAVRRGWWGLGS